MTAYFPDIKMDDDVLALQVLHTNLSVVVMHHCTEKNHYVVHNLSSKGSLFLLIQEGILSLTTGSMVF